MHITILSKNWLYFISSLFTFSATW